jgi:ferric-dicitrate binding protein FerR (iron transport regulator)
VKANPELKRGTVLSIFRPTLKYAAAVILIAALGGYWFLSRNKKMPVAKTETKQTPVNNDVAPGQYKAKLTLADGSTIILDSAKTGQLVQQGEINVLNKDGQLVYEKRGETNKVLYNTLSTSKAETYLTVLSDGTKVWLNSQSSIHYPVAFMGDVRKVEITGEAYFEVAPAVGKNGKRPFIVGVNGMEVEVLGTHFNINSYSNESAIKTTLLEGKIRVHSSASNTEKILTPGEQAVLQDNKIVVNKNVDVDAEVAWRFGYFNFNNADLKTVMRQLERWYDVNVVYEGKVSNDMELIGKIPRSMNLSQVLNVLQTQQVHYKVESHKIIILP